MGLFRVDDLLICNFRGFEKINLTIDPRCTVIHSDNGGGKTTLLEALAIGLGTWFDRLPVKASRPIRASDVYRTTRIVKGLPESVEHFPVEIWCTGEIAGHSIQWSKVLTGGARRSAVSDNSEIRRLANDLWVELRQKADVPMPLLAYYGTQRLFRQLRDTQNRQPGRISKREDGYLDCLDPASNEKQLIQWLYRQALAQAQSGKHLPHVAGIESAVLRALGEDYSRFFYDLGQESPCLVHRDGAVVPWHQFSDGYHTFIGMVADLAWRSVTLNPHWGADAPEQVEGVVAIDEIDLHLHPSWQRRVLGDLIRAFPNLQFVVTTHSPQVLAGARREWVRRISLDGVTPETGFVEGRDSNSILEDIMGDASRPAYTRKQLSVFYDHLEAREFVGAEAILSELELTMGPEDTTLVRARLDLEDRRWE